jgi:hypothetical protein
MTLANVTISSGNVTITNVSVTTANVTTANITNMVSGNVAITGGSINGTTLGATTASTANVTTLTTSSTVTINGGTVNGVAYLDGSKVLTTGSALTFDGTNLTVANGDVTIATNGKKLYVNYIVNNSGTDLNINGATNQIFSIAGSEQMRLTSTGLGIGTSSPAQKLDVAGVGAKISDGTYTGYFGKGSTFASVGGGAASDFAVRSDNALVFATGGPFLRATLDSSGNLGLGVTPSAFGAGRWMQFLSVSAVGQQQNGTANLACNAYESSANSFNYILSAAAARYNVTAGAHQWYTAPSGTAGNAISFTQALTLHASGGLSLGNTSDPGAGSLNIGVGAANSNNYFIRLSAGTSGLSRFIAADTSDAGYIDYDHSVNAWIFRTDGSERARITSGGDLLVGTTSGNSRITAAYSSTNTFGILSENAADNPGVDGAAVIGNLSSSTGTNNTTAVIFRGRSAGADRFYVYGNGNVQNTNNSYGAISDVKLKENITDATPKLENLNRLRVVNYNLKGDTLKQIGLIAQDVEQVFPGLVDSTPDVDPDTKEPTGEVTKSVKYSVLVPMLLKAVQELTVMNDDLRARVAQLENLKGN